MSLDNEIAGLVPFVITAVGFSYLLYKSAKSFIDYTQRKENESFFNEKYLENQDMKD